MAFAFLRADDCGWGHESEQSRHTGALVHAVYVRVVLGRLESLVDSSHRALQRIRGGEVELDLGSAFNNTCTDLEHTDLDGVKLSLCPPCAS